MNVMTKPEQAAVLGEAGRDAVSQEDGEELAGKDWRQAVQE